LNSYDIGKVIVQYILYIHSGGFKVGGPRQDYKRGPLMTSSYSANRDKHFWSSLRYGHRRIRSWDYGMADIAEGENGEGCSWYTTWWEDKAGNTQKLGNSKLAWPLLFIFTHHFSAFTINKLQSLPLSRFHTFPFDKMLGIVAKRNLFTFISLWECMAVM